MSEPSSLEPRMLERRVSNNRYYTYYVIYHYRTTCNSNPVIFVLLRRIQKIFLEEYL